MKRIINTIITLSLLIPLFLVSCLKEDIITDPSVDDIKMYMQDINGEDSLIAEVFAGKKIDIVVYSDADMISIWPGGIRTIMKKKDGITDSIDMFNHPVLVASDCYIDYGLIMAAGLKTSVKEENVSWHSSYIYPKAGQFDLTIVATNHGYAGPDLRRIIHEAGKITVK